MGGGSWVGTAGSASESAVKPTPVLAAGEPLPPLSLLLLLRLGGGSVGTANQATFCRRHSAACAVEARAVGAACAAAGGCAAALVLLAGRGVCGKVSAIARSSAVARSPARQPVRSARRRPTFACVENTQQHGVVSDKSRLYIKPLQPRSCADRRLLPRFGLVI